MLKEMHEGEQIVNQGSPSLDNHEFIENINIDLYMACKGYFTTPYTAYMRVKRILDSFSVNMPIDKQYMLGVAGEITIPVAQYKIPDESSSHFLVFSYVMDEYGYEVYAEITDEEGLDEISQLDND